MNSKGYGRLKAKKQQGQLLKSDKDHLHVFKIDCRKQQQNGWLVKNKGKCKTEVILQREQLDDSTEIQQKKVFVESHQKSCKILPQNKVQSSCSVSVKNSSCQSKIQSILKNDSKSNILIATRSSKNIFKPILQDKQPHPFKLEKLLKQDFFTQKQLSRLTNVQIESIMHMQMKAQSKNRSVQNTTQFRSRKLGNSAKDLEILRLYIEQRAPIIRHVHISKYMQFFAKDTHYRNQFQTNKSSGKLCHDSRAKWQNRLFDNHYANAADYERVKYGVINLTNDPKGVLLCTRYGLSYMTLKRNVRNRCTITDLDSSSGNCEIGTLKYCNHILNKMSDEELKIIFRTSKNKSQNSMKMKSFKQIQIHGPIEFSQDVQEIHVNTKQIANEEQLKAIQQFCERNNIVYKCF